MRLGISISPLATRFGPVLHDADVSALCRELARAGYSGVELSLVTPEAFTPALAAAVADSNLSVLSIATGQSYIRDRLCLYTADASVRRQAISRLEGFIPLARRHSCPIIIGGVRGNELPEPGEMTRVEELGNTAFRELAKAAEREDVTLLLEPINRYETRFFNTLESAARFIAVENFPNVKILADTFHMNIEEPDIVESVESHLDRIGYVHVADSNRRFPGAGHIDFERIASSLRSRGYRGVVGVEILPWPDPLEAASRSIRKLRQLLN